MKKYKILVVNPLVNSEIQELEDLLNSKYIIENSTSTDTHIVYILYIMDTTYRY